MSTKRDHLEGEFLTLIRRGMTAREAAKLLGIHRSTAQRWLKQMADAEPVTRRPVRGHRSWWESDDSRQAAILGAIRTRMCELDPQYDRDDPRDWLTFQQLDDPEIVRLRRQLPWATG